MLHGLNPEIFNITFGCLLLFIIIGIQARRLLLCLACPGLPSSLPFLCTPPRSEPKLESVTTHLDNGNRSAFRLDLNFILISISPHLPSSIAQHRSLLTSHDMSVRFSTAAGVTLRRFYRVLIPTHPDSVPGACMQDIPSALPDLCLVACKTFCVPSAASLRDQQKQTWCTNIHGQQVWPVSSLL